MDPTTDTPTSEPATAVAEVADDFDPFTLTPGTFEEIHTDWMRFHDEWNAGRIDSTGVPTGECIAYCNGKLLGHGPDMEPLRQRIAREHRLHPDRIYIMRLWPYLDPE